MLGPNPFHSMWESAEYRERFDEIIEILIKFRMQNPSPIDFFGCQHFFDADLPKNDQAF